jgi:hypothetical protein
MMQVDGSLEHNEMNFESLTTKNVGARILSTLGHIARNITSMQFPPMLACTPYLGKVLSKRHQFEDKFLYQILWESQFNSTEERITLRHTKPLPPD